MGLADGADEPFARELGLAVRAHGQAFGLLGDEVDVGHAVDGGGGGEQEAADAGFGCGFQDGAQAFDVLAVVVQRAFDGFADLLLGGDVDDAVDVVLAQDAVEDVAVEDGAALQADAFGQPGRVSGAEVVEDDDLLAAVDEGLHHVRSDVSRHHL